MFHNMHHQRPFFAIKYLFLHLFPSFRLAIKNIFSLPSPILSDIVKSDTRLLSIAPILCS